jgi:NAD(P)-dependent dehydrogenase (short-subunit alcohol dehydrogenase family)
MSASAAQALAGRVAIVTGGAASLGRAIDEGGARRGASVAGVLGPISSRIVDCGWTAQ